jgi:hypothetical protein
MLKWVAAGIAVVVVSVGLWAFEPWRLFTSSTVDEAVPGVDGTSVDGSIREVAETTAPRPRGDRDQPRPSASGDAAEPRLTIIGEGELETAEHDTSGTAFVVEEADGSRFLRLEDLATSDGPDLYVGLSDAPSGGEWGSYDDGRYVQLAPLKATHGNQNYEIPDDVDLDALTTVVIWCDRFNVAFGTADVAA